MTVERDRQNSEKRPNSASHQKWCDLSKPINNQLPLSTPLAASSTALLREEWKEAESASFALGLFPDVMWDELKEALEAINFKITDR